MSLAGFVIMGVAGCGKSSVGAGAGAALGLSYIDGDDLHPEANVAKMASGTPLTDEDRAPWLGFVGRALAEAEMPVLIGCSALKRRYRDLIRAEAGGDVHFLHLAAPQPVIAARMAAREGHFMPPSLLQSQFDALEPLEADEQGVEIDIDRPIEAVITTATKYIREIRT